MRKRVRNELWYCCPSELPVGGTCSKTCSSSGSSSSSFPLARSSHLRCFWMLHAMHRKVCVFFFPCAHRDVAFNVCKSRCWPLVDFVHDTCGANRYGGTISTDSYSCAKGCAGMKDQKEEDPDKFCKIPASKRLDECDKDCSDKSHDPANVAQCQYGCQYWQ